MEHRAFHVEAVNRMSLAVELHRHALAHRIDRHLAHREVQGILAHHDIVRQFRLVGLGTQDAPEFQEGAHLVGGRNRVEGRIVLDP